MITHDDIDILARYSRTDGRREWVTVCTWLRPGEVVAHMDDPAEPLTDEQIETMVQQDETLRYHFALNGGAGPVSEKGKKIIRSVMAGWVAT